MAWLSRKNDCGRIRQGLAEFVADRLDITTTWAQRHIANCPRCQRQLLGSNRLRLAFLMVKAQPHRLDLLLRANRRAIGVLSGKLRELPKAQKLRNVLPKPALRERLGKYTQGIGHAAACLLVLILMRMSIFSSLTKVQNQGEQFVKDYYARHLELDLLDDIPDDTT